MVAEIIDLNAFKAEFEKIKSNKELREKAIETIQQKVSDLDEKIVVAKRVASIRAKVDDLCQRRSKNTPEAGVKVHHLL